MDLGKLLRRGAVAAAVLLDLQAVASADPVGYDGRFIFSGSAPRAIAMDFIVDATNADDWAFWATFGDTVGVAVSRIGGEPDPIKRLYARTLVDTNEPIRPDGTDSFSISAPDPKR